MAKLRSSRRYQPHDGLHGGWASSVVNKREPSLIKLIDPVLILLLPRLFFSKSFREILCLSPLTAEQFTYKRSHFPRQRSSPTLPHPFMKPSRDGMGRATQQDTSPSVDAEIKSPALHSIFFFFKLTVLDAENLENGPTYQTRSDSPV